MALPKKWSLALVFLATALGLFAFPSAARSATTFTVTTIADPGDGTCAAAGTGDGCTLREAIAAANGTAGDDIIVFAAGVTGTIQLTAALPNLSSNISLQGPGANLLTVRRNSSAVFRIFNANNGTSSGPTISISGLGIANGSGKASGDNFGGAIYGQSATLTVTGCTISGNQAGFGGGIDNRASGGSATLTVQGCTFSTNQSDFGGGGILNESYSSGTATATVRNCTFAGNSSPADGGAIRNAAHGGSATLTVQNCTFSGNSSTSSAVGSIFNWNDTNSPGFSAQTEIGDTIFQVSSGANLGNSGVTGGAASITSLGYNISNDSGGGFLAAAGDQIQTDPKLDPAGLQNNGGPLQTIALQSSSPAVNAGDPNFTPPPAFDERGSGFNRVARGRLDIGAFELQDPVQSGATLIVNTTADHDDSVCGTADCTLREAINAANAASATKTIAFAANVTGAITLAQGELVITKDVTVTGPGARVLAVDANLASRVLAIDGGTGPEITVAISGLTFTRGQVNGNGGGIYSNASTTLTNCTISANSATGGPGDGEYGGGIYTTRSMTLTGCTVSGNSALGGSFSAKSNVSTAGGTGQGGGVYNASILTVTNSTFTGNTAQGGRGSHKDVGQAGAGGNGSGGAMVNQGTLIVTNCTVSANAAIHGLGGSGNPSGANGTGQGGGISNPDPLSLPQVTNTLIAGNTGADGGPDVFGPFTSKGFNLIGKTDGSTGFTATGDKSGTVASPLDPKLGSLANNSGPTDTMALLTGSPAIDAGNDTSAPATDQRGFSRVGQSDIGAYEFGGALPTPTPTPTPIPTATPTPNPTPISTATPTPNPTPISTATPTPNPTPLPTATPTPNPTPVPTATPTPNPTPVPTATPISTPTPSSGSLGNISTRLQVGTGNNVLFAGFIIQGNGSKTVLIRSSGPSLTSFGLPGALSDPQLELHDANNTIGTNDDWQTTQLGGVITSDQVAAIQNSGAAPLDPAEPAIIATLPAGGYTAIVQGVGGTQGIATVEVYDLSPNNGATLANISTRGFIQTGDNVMIGGFIVVDQASTVLIRATGPSLVPFGINNALANPRIELHDANGTLAGNDDWQTTQPGGIITSDQSAAIQNSGLAPGDLAESAIIATLAPGAYTAIAQGVDGGTGVGLVEVFALP
jgi:CSLREA domain-containing protein